MTTSNAHTSTDTASTKVPFKPEALPTTARGASVTRASADILALVHQGAAKEPRIDSRLLAERLAVLHKSTRGLIEKYKTEMEAKTGKIPFKTEALPSGQRERFYLLNEAQAIAVLALTRNNPHVVDLKVKLAQAFVEARTALAAYRDAALPSFRALQDALAAVPGASGAGPWFFSNVNKLVNSVAGIPAGSRLGGDAVMQATMMMLHTVAARLVAGATDTKDAYARVKAGLDPMRATFTPSST